MYSWLTTSRRALAVPVERQHREEVVVVAELLRLRLRRSACGGRTPARPARPGRPSGSRPRGRTRSARRRCRACSAGRLKVSAPLPRPPRPSRAGASRARPASPAGAASAGSRRGAGSRRRRSRAPGRRRRRPGRPAAGHLGVDDVAEVRVVATVRHRVGARVAAAVQAGHARRAAWRLARAGSSRALVMGRSLLAGVGAAGPRADARTGRR